MRVWLQLGRVSNLPTVWTNTLAAIALAGGALAPGPLGLLLLAMSLAYVGGMYLNDAFDRHIDAVERPERPIPSGQVQARQVFVAGFGMLAGGVGLTVAAADLAGRRSLGPAAMAAVGLAAVIVLYNWHHKENPLSPFIMGLARVGVYACAAMASTDQPGDGVYWGMLALLGYLIGLTYVAKQESFNRIGHYWPLLFLGSPFGFVHLLELPLARACYAGLLVWVAWSLYGVLGPKRKVGPAVARFIAGMCLLDAMWVGSTGNATWVLACVGAFVLTRLGQRVIAGT